MGARPSPDLVAEWYARLPPGMDIETPRGVLKADRPGGRALRRALRSSLLRGPKAEITGLGSAADHLRLPISYAHEHMGAASWRMPRIGTVRDKDGHGRAFGRHVDLHQQRRILRMLAFGASTRSAAAEVKVSLTLVGAIRRAALAWKDPDDE